jgi:hypothetical protein
MGENKLQSGRNGLDGGDGPLMRMTRMPKHENSVAEHNMTYDLRHSIGTDTIKRNTAQRYPLMAMNMLLSSRVKEYP